MDVKRFMAANSIILVDKGVPGIYIHSLLGSRNYLKGVNDTGMNRMINRERLSEEEVTRDLSNPGSVRYQVLEGFLHLLNVRKQVQAFHYSVERTVLKSDERLFVMERVNKGESILGVVNVSSNTVESPQYQGKYDLISKTRFEGNIEPYGVYFFK